ncbi:hypothetical protein N665_0373s0041 [Sinapis alba]|nr:hypothetical protein N665_0373s0041 [Sinapis alba]
MVFSRYGKSSFFDKVNSNQLLTTTSQASSTPQLVSLSLKVCFSTHSHEILGTIYVVLRGTSRNYDWISVLGARPTSADMLLRGPEQSGSGSKVVEAGSTYSSDSEDEERCKVMLGWLTIYTSNHAESKFTKLSLRLQLLTKIKELLLKYKDEKTSVVLTGHSLGATEAVGNKEFKDEVTRHKNLKIVHVRNKIDPLTRYPGGLLGYVDRGTNFVIETNKSPYLKDSRNPGDWHGLQAMLHVVAGWNGKKGEFKLMKRSIALVNKSCEVLVGGEEQMNNQGCKWLMGHFSS